MCQISCHRCRLKLGIWLRCGNCEMPLFDVLPFSSAIPIKSPQFNAMMDAVIPSLQDIINGGDTSKALKSADRELKRIGF